jgi:hypothetical protein
VGRRLCVALGRLSGGRRTTRWGPPWAVGLPRTLMVHFTGNRIDNTACSKYVVHELQV